MRMIDYPSPNFDVRRDEARPELIIIHYTSMKDTAAALERLSDPAAKVSCHYLIDEAGNIYRMVDEEKRAWHAGVAQWHDRNDINSCSIGIEISNRNNQPYTNAQLFALGLLCKDLMHRHNIPPENVIGHSDIAPDRKQDPGAHFPWEKLSRHGIGRWPVPTLRDKFNAAAAARKPQKLKTLLKKAGYPVDAFGPDKPSLPELVTAFQRHFQPAVFKQPDNIGKPTAETVALLRALGRAPKTFKP